MGNLTPSKLEKALGGSFPENEHYFGLENSGNTCYCNSVLQSLYYCGVFRHQVMNYNNNTLKMPPKDEDDETLLTALSELFNNIATHKKKTGILNPRKFVNKLRKENEIFRGHMHQDAHEFLNYLLNEVADLLTKEQKEEKKQIEKLVATQSEESKTWVHQIFEGTLTNETKCLGCETVTNKDESFLDLSLDVEQNSSVSYCLRNFSSTETLGGADKFFCDKCCSLQEAQKRMRIKKLPKILALHLKRFKYFEEIQRYRKLSYRVVFPLELKLVNTSDDAEDPDRMYHLFAVVIHVGSGPHQGHYISIIKSHSHWLVFDDENVELIDEMYIQNYFGSAQDNYGQSTSAGYILFYNSAPTSKYDVNNAKNSDFIPLNSLNL